MAEPTSTLVDVIQYLKSDEDGIKGTPTPTSEMKALSAEDRVELRASLDVVRASK